ncbi:hypothetical protein CFP56_033431 [Quercus suber]|uniref:Uncharacterized protein n=1 Tax=Quercus suber TaxID=58331 RepID=A0AAW0LRP9_QUESU
MHGPLPPNSDALTSNHHLCLLDYHRILSSGALLRTDSLRQSSKIASWSVGLISETQEQLAGFNGWSQLTILQVGPTLLRNLVLFMWV